jgi:hypothetical protein
MKNLRVIAIVVVALLIISSDAAAQCGMCKAIADGGANSEGAIGLGLNKGIIFLMAIPYLLFFFVLRKRVVRFYREFRGIYEDKDMKSAE